MREKKRGMTIKQKIRLSNIMMVLIPIAVTAMIIVISLHTSLGSYWYTLETMYQDENGIQSAQSLIYTYQQELWEYNWAECKVLEDTGVIRKNEEMNRLEAKLSKMGYHFLIMKNGEEIYSNISEEEMETAREVAGEAINSAKTLTASRHEVSVIKHTFYHGEKVFSIIAVNCGGADQEVVSYLQSYIMKYLLGFVIIFLLLTVAVNFILSFWISRSVLEPLKKLSDGTKEIREGNLDMVLDYNKPDEFGEVCRDFDEMRANLKKSVEQQLVYEKRKRDLIIGISHDLRTPLTSISGYLDGLLDGIANTPEKRERYLQAIKTRAKDLSRLVDSLSEYNRLDSRSFHYHLKPEELKSFIGQYLVFYEDEAGQNHVEIEFSCEEDRYPVFLDHNEFKRVFDNLFTNTVRYRNRDHSHVVIALRGLEDFTMVEIVFADDGPGVPEESLENIFESFYRVDGARSNSGVGSGIGLAVVKEIIIGHGGAVYAENREGLAVVISLPIMKEK